MGKLCAISGVTGQIGSYLAEHLLSKGYTVVGLIRRVASRNYDNIASIITRPDFILEDCDITDQNSVFNLLKKYQPDEFYNLAAQSFVHISFDQPKHTFDVDAMGVLNILEGIKNISPNTKAYFASTSELFGKGISCEYAVEQYDVRWDGTKDNRPLTDIITKGPFQDEDTPFIPQSPYAVAKLAAHHLVRLYRESYNLFVCSGILFNSESCRRGKEFVTRKITDYVARLSLSKDRKEFPLLRLGNLEAKRDWGFAGDSARAMYLMLQQDTADDYVIATGETHSIKELLDISFSVIGEDWKDFVVVDDKFKRPAEVDYLLGDSTKLRSKLNWAPTMKFKDLIEGMVHSDIARNK